MVNANKGSLGLEIIVKLSMSKVVNVHFFSAPQWSNSFACSCNTSEKTKLFFSRHPNQPCHWLWPLFSHLPNTVVHIIILLPSAWSNVGNWCYSLKCFVKYWRHKCLSTWAFLLKKHIKAEYGYGPYKRQGLYGGGFEPLKCFSDVC